MPLETCVICHQNHSFNKYARLKMRLYKNGYLICMNVCDADAFKDLLSFHICMLHT